MTNIVEVFGQFAVKLDDVPHLFETKEEARGALFMHEQKSSIEDRIIAYCLHEEIEGKVAVSRGNMIRNFLSFEATLPLKNEATPDTPAATPIAEKDPLYDVA